MIDGKHLGQGLPSPLAMDDDDVRLPAVSLRVVSGLPEPWKAWLLEVGAFPQSLAEGAPIAFFLEALRERVRKVYPALRQEVCIQFWKLSAANGADTVSGHASEWSPQYGLGLWPGRRPPQGWDQTMMMDAAAAIIRGSEPELPAHRLLRLQCSPEELDDAVDELRGLGLLLQIYSREEKAALDSRLSGRYLPTITDTAFRRAEFLLPLLSLQVLSAVRTAEQLDDWMCGIELYVRESAEDNGVLLLSRIPLPLDPPSSGAA